MKHKPATKTGEAMKAFNAQIRSIEKRIARLEKERRKKGRNQEGANREEKQNKQSSALTHDFLAYDKSITYSIPEKNISQIVVDSGKSRWHD